MANILGGALLALLMQAHGPQVEFETDTQAATESCTQGREAALRSGTVTDAQWKEIIACVFANTAAQMDTQLPRKMDAITTLVSVSSTGATFNYTYVLDLAKADVRQENIDSLEAATRENACTDSSMTQTIGLGGSYFYRWVDRSGAKITSMLIDAC